MTHAVQNSWKSVGLINYSPQRVSLVNSYTTRMKLKRYQRGIVNDKIGHLMINCTMHFLSCICQIRVFSVLTLVIPKGIAALIKLTDSLLRGRGGGVGHCINCSWDDNKLRWLKCVLYGTGLSTEYKYWSRFFFVGVKKNLRLFSG